jgi:dihydroxyacetone kinase-like protein
MRTPELITTIDRALVHLEGCADELRDLDAALGDGDLGVTVAAGCRAVRKALDCLTDDAAPAEVLKAAAAAFAKANPSTMAALVGGALLAGARGLGDTEELDRTAALAVGRAAAESIAARGKAQLGDKTVLDALVPSLDAMEAAPEEPRAAGVAAARQAVEETMSLQSMRGRASWMGERSKGLQDPGATAYLHFLEGLASAGSEKHGE